MPDDRDQHLGQGQAHPAVALGLDDHERAGLGDREVRAGDPDLGPQELLAQVQPRGVGQLAGVVGEVVGRGPSGRRHPSPEDLPDLGPVAMDRRHQDVQGRSSPSWTISSARSVSQAAMPSAGERLVEPDLLGDHRLDLDDLVDAVGPRDRPPRRDRPRPRREPSGPRRRARSATPRAVAGACRARAGRRPSGRRRPAAASSQSGTSATTRARLSRIVCVAWARLCRSWVSPSAVRAATGNGGIPTKVAVIRMLAPSTARISARCMTRTPERCRESSPPMCIRQELSPATSTSASVSRTCRALSAPIATETSAFFTANVPPNPQHSSAPRAGRPGSARAPPPAAVAAGRRRPAAAASGTSGGRSRGAGSTRPTSVTPSTSTRNSLSSWTFGPSSVDGARRDPRRRRAPRPSGAGAAPTRRTSPTGVTTASYPSNADTKRAHDRHRLVEVAGVDHRLAAAGLRLGEVDVDAEAGEQLDDGPAGVGEQRVVHTRDHQCDAHAAHHAAHADDGRSACLGGVPVETQVRLVTAYVVRAAHQRPHRSEVRQVGAERPRLDQHVPQGRGLGRSGEHREPARIGGEPAEQGVLSAATDDVDDRDLVTARGAHAVRTCRR